MLNYSANGPSGYNLTNSLRFRSSASAYLNRTPTVAGNRKTWTWSAWVKLGNVTVRQEFFSAGSTPNSVFYDDLQGFGMDGVFSGTRTQRYTSAKYRDPSAWYHIVAVLDTTQATAANRMRMYVNGSQVALDVVGTGSYPAQDSTQEINNTVTHNIGRRSSVPDAYMDSYITEINFIDGQALTPSSFGSFNSITGVWQPARYTGTYGTNGFYLNFTDIALTSGSNTGLGRDFSGNGNFWNTNNISVTSGVTYDAMSDVPTLTSATVANYAVMNPLVRLYGTATLSDANLKINDTSTGGGAGYATIAVTSGKFYYEFTPSAVGKLCGMGVTFASTYTFGYDGCYLSNGTVSNTTGGTATTYASYTTNDIIGVAFDADAGKVWFYKNGTLQAGDPVAGTSPAFTWAVNSLVTATYAMDNSAGTVGINANFGQRPFSYTPPTGYNRLNTFNLPTPTILQGNKYMDATLYTGNGSTQTITNAAGFRPDFVWIKSRSNANDHVLGNSLCGATQVLYSNGTDAELSNSCLTSFNSNGFSLNAIGGQAPKYNANGTTYVGWQWQAGQGSTSSNTSGSITSTVSVNTTAGFSVVTWSGNSTSGATIGHGLGVAPKMFIVKNRTNAEGWVVGHTSIGWSNFLQINNTNASASSAFPWNNTAPSSTLITLGSGTGTNGSGYTYVGYAFAEIAGFSRFGSYTGNGSADGPFVYTGFRPKFVMVKNTAIASNWLMYDTQRDLYNVTDKTLIANSSDAEGVYADVKLDTLSNGFKIRQTSTNLNGSGNSIIYMAFAENPFKNALAR